MIRISYVDFWSRFEPKKFWLSKFFQNRYKDNFIYDSDPNDSDIIIGSCFSNEIRKYKNSKAIKVFYTGENVRPDLINYDYSMSFDFDSYNGKNIRLPLWYLYVNWWNENDLIENVSMEEYNRKFNPEEIYQRNGFCCIVIGNPVENRIQVVNELNLYKKVDGFGNVFGNRYDGRKINLLSSYRFNICFENSIYPGYHTEKLLEAKIAGCIPIYYGDNTVSLDFNDKCFINYKDFNSPKELKEYVIELDQDKNKFINIASEPLFTKQPKFTEINKFWDHILNNL